MFTMFFGLIYRNISRSKPSVSEATLKLQQMFLIALGIQVKLLMSVQVYPVSASSRSEHQQKKSNKQLGKVVTTDTPVHAKQYRKRNSGLSYPLLDLYYFACTDVTTFPNCLLYKRSHLSFGKVFKFLISKTKFVIFEGSF